MKPALPVAVVICALAGCAPLGVSSGGGPPSASPRRSASAARAPRGAPRGPLATAEATHEYPTPVAPQTARAPAPGPEQAVRAFATAYINWSADTVSADMARLTERSVGQARSAMALAAGQTGHDYELQRGGVANQGTVQAVAPFAGHADEYLVVTLERTTSSDPSAYAGLAPAWHVALATVSQVAPGRWAVSGWQPES